MESPFYDFFFLLPDEEEEKEEEEIKPGLTHSQPSLLLLGTVAALTWLALALPRKESTIASRRRGKDHVFRSPAFLCALERGKSPGDYI